MNRNISGGSKYFTRRHSEREIFCRRIVFRGRGIRMEEILSKEDTLKEENILGISIFLKRKF